MAATTWVKWAIYATQVVSHEQGDVRLRLGQLACGRVGVLATATEPPSVQHDLLRAFVGLRAFGPRLASCLQGRSPGRLPFSTERLDLGGSTLT